MTTENTANGNGNGLPPAREAIVEQAQRIHQEVAHDRDLLRDEVMRLKSDIAGYKVALEAKDAQINDMQSRVHEMTIIRDAQVMKAEQYKAVLISIAAQLRAFQIESAPFIREREEEIIIGGA